MGSKLVSRIGIIIVAALGVGYVASEIWPKQAAEVMLTGLFASAGLSEKVVETSKGQIHYLEGGEGQTVVFLHGIFALKEHWVDMSRELSGNHRVMILDLPGFGENQRLNQSEYDYQNQAKNVIEALDQIGIDEFHIAANSMGSQIAATVAKAYPKRIKSIAFIGSPDGVTSPERSDMEKALISGRTPLVVTNRNEYAERMAWLFPEEPFIPRPMARAWSMNEVSNAEINPKIWNAVQGSTITPLEQIAPDLKQPTLLIWCKEDRIFHVSGAAVLHQVLPHNKLITPENCGHLPMLDRPSETGVELRNFLSGLTPK